MVLVYIASAAALIGMVLVILSQQRKALAGRWKRLGLGLGGIMLFLAGAFFILMGLNIRPYIPLTGQRTIATVRIRTLYPVAKTYSVTILRHDGAKANTTCILQGDEMGLSGRAQVWRNWTALFGHAHTYVLDRAVSRYYHFIPPHIGAEPITSCTITPKRPKIDYFMPGALMDGMIDMIIAHQRPIRPLSYVPLEDGATYDMVMTPEGIVPRRHIIKMHAV